MPKLVDVADRVTVSPLQMVVLSVWIIAVPVWLGCTVNVMPFEVAVPPKIQVVPFPPGVMVAITWSPAFGL